MSNGIDDLANLFKLNQSDQSGQISDKRKSALMAVVTHQQNAYKENRERNLKANRTFLALGGVFALSTILMVIGFVFNSDFTVGGVIGAIISGIWGGIYTFKHLSDTPLHNLRVKLDESYTNLQGLPVKSDIEKQYLKIKRRNQKVFLGVASFVAEKTAIDPSIIRVVFIAMAFVSFGTFLPAYIITGFIVNALHNSKE